MKKVLAAILLAIGGMMAGTGALAQVQMDVYFTANAMERETAERLMELTRRTFPQAQWNCRQAEDEESDLRALILADDVPEIVVCAPGEANLWVSDGLFAALDGRVTDADRIDEQVLGACVQDESLFMLPLVARHRQMAVNRRLMEKRRLDSMTNPIEHPLWYPMEFDQILEEFALADHPALEICLPSRKTAARSKRCCKRYTAAHGWMKKANVRRQSTSMCARRWNGCKTA